MHGDDCIANRCLAASAAIDRGWRAMHLGGWMASSRRHNWKPPGWRPWNCPVTSWNTEKAVTDPQPVLMSDLAARCASGELDQFTALAMMIMLSSAAGESTASLLGSAAWILVTHPEVQRHVRENPDQLGAFIEETLRFEPPFRGH
jgi:hypothetical protein